MKISQKKITIASVESFTGGLFASEIIKTPGASKYFKGALVTYWNEIKEKLGIDTSKGVINKNVVLEMAIKGKDFFDVDYCIAFSGNAGPEAMENKPIGLVFIAINDKVYELNFGAIERNLIRQKSVDFAIEKLEEILN